MHIFLPNCTNNSNHLTAGMGKLVTWGDHGKLNTDVYPSSRLKPEPRSREAATLSAVPLFRPETLTRG